MSLKIQQRFYGLLFHLRRGIRRKILKDLKICFKKRIRLTKTLWSNKSVKAKMRFKGIKVKFLMMEKKHVENLLITKTRLSPCPKTDFFLYDCSTLNKITKTKKLSVYLKALRNFKFFYICTNFWILKNIIFQKFLEIGFTVALFPIKF